MWSYLRRNRNLLVGLVILIAIALFCILGRLFWDLDLGYPLKSKPKQPPSWEHPFGTDKQGRDLLAVMIIGTPKTFFIGFAGGLIGVAIGTCLALVAAYKGGIIDAIVRGMVDVGLTIPPLLVLILFAVSIKSALSVPQMALVVAALAWLFPTRTIRAQVLTIRERAYIQVARMSGASSRQMIFGEIMPNLLPYLAATFVGSVSAGILASIGLELLGLSNLDSNSLGITLYWANYWASLLNGWWWWLLPPVLMIIFLFVGLFNVAIGLDELANPRTRRRV
jgi:peptide/nickel transport system permease protein